MKSLKNVEAGDFVMLCGDSVVPDVQPYKPYKVTWVHDDTDDKFFGYIDDSGKQKYDHTSDAPYISSSCGSEWIIVDPREETIRKIQEKMREINDLLELLK